MTSGTSCLSQFIHNLPLNTQNRNITKAQKSALTSAFYRCDEGQKGFLSREDFKVAVLSLLGYKPSKYEVNQIIGLKRDEAEYEGGIKLEDFVEVMSHKMASIDEDDVIRQTFLLFDSQCRGFLTVEDLKKVLARLAPHIAAHNVEAAFREIDRDGDGRVSYKDFEFMMKYNCDDGF